MELVIGILLILLSTYGIASFTQQLKKDENLAILGGFAYGCGGMVFLYGCIFVIEFLWEIMK